MGCTALVFMVLSATVSRLKLSSANSVGTPPSFTSDGGPPATYVVDVQQGDNNLVLPCEVSGTPPITVSWFREGILIRQIPVDEENNGTLSISVTESEANVTAPREGTNYYCEATNRIGLGNYSVTLRSRNVNVSHYFFGGFRNTEVRDVMIKTVLNAEVIMECDFNPSNPDPEVTWFADGTTMLDGAGGRQFLEGGRYLYIEPLIAALRGLRYHCELRNSRYNNGMTIRAPTTYTLSTDLGNDKFIVYKDLGIRVGMVGQAVSFIYAAASKDSSGLLLPITVRCSSDSQVTFVYRNPALIVTVMEANNMDHFNFSCPLFVIPRNVSGTIIFAEQTSITTPVPNDPSLTDRERLVSNGSVEYPCEASGRPAPTITWYYNGAVVQSGSGGVVVSGDGTLTISAPQVSHSGIYQCFARNQFGEDSRTQILEVRGPVIQILDYVSDFPIVEHNQNNFLLPPLETTNLGITFRVETTFVGVPSRDDFCPNVQWQINGTDIVNDTVYAVSNSCGIRENEKIHLFTLTIATFTLNTIGEYLFSSREAAVFKQLIVTFQECNKSGPDKPASNGSRVDVRCWCRDIIPANVSWFKDGKNLNDTDQIATSQAMNNVFVLTIEPVRVMDAGRYTCTITTGAGQYSGEINVDVLGNNGGTTIFKDAFIATGVALAFIVAESEC